jgi:transaldolase
MQLFLDSADLREIARWLCEGIVDGVTTNPTILCKDGVSDLAECAVQLARLLENRPLSLEVTSDEQAEMLIHGRQLASWAPNVVVKIPVINSRGESCLAVIHALATDRIAVNATAILSFNQAILAAKAGATYVSIFAGRIADEGNDAAGVIGNVRQWLDRWQHPAKIIVGSIRSVIDIQNAAVAGAHIITVPPSLITKMVDHKYTRETVLQFKQDAERALQQVPERVIPLAARSS